MGFEERVRVQFSAISLMLAMMAGGVCAGQAVPAAPGAAAPSTVSAAPAGASAALLQPSLTGILQAMGTLRTEKWKAPLPVRDETDSNIRSIRRDIDTVLPPMLATADAAPGSVAQGLPVLRNVDALYDVLLRVAAVGKMAAPAQQSAALEQAIAALDASRRTLGDRLQDAAMAKDKQVSDLQAALRAVPPPVVAAPVVTMPAPAPVKKRVVKKKPKPVVAPVAPAGATPPKTP